MVKVFHMIRMSLSLLLAIFLCFSSANAQEGDSSFSVETDCIVVKQKLEELIKNTPVRYDPKSASVLSAQYSLLVNDCITAAFEALAEAHEVARVYLVTAIEFRITMANKELLRENLLLEPRLFRAVQKLKLEFEFKDLLLEGVRQIHGLPIDWLCYIAMWFKEDEAIIRELRALMESVRGRYFRDLHSALSECAGLDLSAEVKVAWSNALASKYEDPFMAVVLVAYGEKKAMDLLLSERFERNIIQNEPIRNIAARYLPMPSSSEDLVAYWKMNREVLLFDAERQVFFVNEK